MTGADRTLGDGPPVSAGLPETASRIVSGLLGTRTRSVELLRQGVMTFKCIVQTESDENIIVRFYPPGRATVVNQEPDLLGRCRQAGIRVPRVIGDSRTGPPSDLAYVSYYKIAGATLSSYLLTCGPRQKYTVAEDLARQLLKLQSIQFQGAGELVSSNEARDLTWRSFVDHSMRSGLKAVQRHVLLDQSLVAKIFQILNRGIPVPAHQTHSLVWGDINFDNIIVDADSHIAGLIDFESCLSGDPLCTLGYAFSAHGTNPFFAQLLRSWPILLTAEDQELILFYAVLRTLRLARYAHLPLPTGYPRDALTDIFPGTVPALARLTRHLLGTTGEG